jgi:hypothetical protein
VSARPILFSGPMVRAILAGCKTQTRRALKPQPAADARYAGVHFAHDEPDSFFFNSPRGPMKVRQQIEEGDHLWVKETWRTYSTLDADPPRNIIGMRVWYEADDGYKPQSRTRSSIHMPRWASRLTLTVTDVRVERLQALSEADAIAEGVERDEDAGAWRDYEMPSMQCCGGPRSSYATLWDSINGPGSWDANPWVAAYTFTIHRQNVDALLSETGAAA